MSESETKSNIATHGMSRQESLLYSQMVEQLVKIPNAIAQGIAFRRDL
jgi:hypothetical protein